MNQRKHFRSLSGIKKADWKNKYNHLKKYHIRKREESKKKKRNSVVGAEVRKSKEKEGV